MRKVILYILMLTCGLNGAVTKKVSPKGTPITTVQERKVWLNMCSNFIEKKNELLSDQNNLFNYENIEKEEEKTPIVIPVIQPEESKASNELVILQKVGEAIKPQGHIIVNGKFALCLNGSRIMTTKTILNAKTRKHTFKIIVKDITKNQFVLQLNQHILTFNY